MSAATKILTDLARVGARWWAQPRLNLSSQESGVGSVVSDQSDLP
jgi:hypothetical protein